MAIDPSEFPQEPTPEPAAPEPPSPWQALEQRGFDPSRYDTDAIVNGANFYQALSDRNYRDGAIAQVLHSAGFPEDLTVAELRELARAQAEPDPFAAFQQEPGYEEQYQPQPGIDPAALQAAMNAEIERRFRERDQAEEQRRAQDAMEREFMGELDKVSSQHSLSTFAKESVAGAAVRLRQQMPYATTADVMKQAHKMYDEDRRAALAALAQQQQDAPALGDLGDGPPPSTQQVPKDAREAAEMWRQMAGDA